MLHLVTGRAGTGKTTYVRSVLGKLAEQQDQDGRLLLIVPEQYSFLSERALLTQFGPVLGQRMEVLSFTRLADYVFRELGGMAGSTADDATKIILMLRALNGVKDQLDFYGKQTESVPFATELLHCVRELHQARITTEDLRKSSGLCGSRTLARKMNELALILDTYAALFAGTYQDEDLLPERLLKKLDTTHFFEGYTICIDGFKGFTGQELAILERLLRQCKDVYLTLCTDNLFGKNPNLCFAAVNETGKAVRALAQKNNISVDTLSMEYSKYASADLAYLEQNLFVPGAEAYAGDAKGVHLFAAHDRSEECNYIAATAKKLLREQGLRLKDMAVVVRREDHYKNELLAAFRRYGIPAFDDARQPILNQPLITVCTSVLSLLVGGFTTENLLHYLKTGLGPLALSEVAELENYALLWNLKSKDWQQEFTLHPEGLGVAANEASEKKLATLNQWREAVMIPLFTLKRDVKDQSAEGICKALYYFLTDTKVPEKSKDIAVAFNDDGFTALANEQNRVWELLMDLFDKLSTAGGDAVMSLPAFTNLFSAVLSMADLGSIPTALEEITIGAADRIRLDNPKVVFVAGCEEGNFPSTVGQTGIFTATDRKNLADVGLALSLSDELKAHEERYMAYAAATAGTEQVYLSYCILDGSAGQKPSLLISSTKELFPEVELLHAADLPEAYFAESEATAFSSYTKLWNSPLPKELEEAASLRQVLTENPSMADRLAVMDQAVNPRDFAISDPALATRLFGENMGLSASRVDVYHHCAFQYFCKFGLCAQPRKAATLDPAQSGTVIHYVLEQIIKDNHMDALIDMDVAARNAAVDHWLNTYVANEMGGLEDKPVRFRYLYRRLALTLYDVVDRLVEEFKLSDFRPVDFELSIGEKENEPSVPAYTLGLKNGGFLSIYGSIDRVDTYEKDGKTFVRIVDYKSGGKEFSLNEVINYGLNMQMLIYLFALEQNGAERYGQVEPSGIFYYPAKRASLSMSSKQADGDTVAKEKIKKDMGNGLFLSNTEVLEAMEHGLNKRFIPVDDKLVDSKGQLKKGLITPAAFQKLHCRVDDILVAMAESLQEGIIPANPTRGTGFERTCEWCDYYPICRLEEDAYEDNAFYKEISSVKHGDALQMLEEMEVNDHA